LLPVDRVKLTIAVWFGLIQLYEMKTAYQTKLRSLEEKLSIRFKLNAVFDLD
jgi:hypothetical protein